MSDIYKVFLTVLLGANIVSADDAPGGAVMDTALASEIRGILDRENASAEPTDAAKKFASQLSEFIAQASANEVTNSEQTRSAKTSKGADIERGVSMDKMKDMMQNWTKTVKEKAKIWWGKTKTLAEQVKDWREKATNGLKRLTDRMSFKDSTGKEITGQYKSLNINTYMNE